MGLMLACLSRKVSMAFMIFILLSPYNPGMACTG